MDRIALNGRFSGTLQPTGTQTAAYQLFDAIVRERRNVELVIFADRRFPKVCHWAEIPNTILVHTPFQDWKGSRSHLWEQLQLPRLGHRYGCSVIHNPMTTCPRWFNGCKSVVTLHDLNFYLHPKWFTRSFRLAYALCAVPGVKASQRVVTISKYVREQAEKHFHLPPPQLKTIYNGVKTLHPISIPLQAGPKYLLCVGSLQPHKNLARMIKAYLLIKEEHPDLELHIVGRPQPRFAEDKELSSFLASPGVKLLGYLSEDDLASAYARAAVFCYPSLEEGFGLPVLEAMSLGSLVLTSNLSCLPEISGPSAEIVDPHSVDAIAAGLRRLLALSGSERADRIHEGKHWAAKFSWRAAAQAYLNIYDELLA